MSEFWRGRRVFLTGHTGFKGAWLAFILGELGAEVRGFALPPRGEPNLFVLLSPWPRLDSVLGDLRDPAAVAGALRGFAPDIVIHMAAQAFVRASYREPAATFATNVMGTVHLLDALRAAPSAAAILVVTSDKVYRNLEQGTAFRESDALGGDDPYSASKAACEIAVQAWRASFARHGGARLASARAGNVIGGGDWGEDRLVPDVVRAWRQGQPVALRHPDSVRPWQHVLDVLSGYLDYAERLATPGDGGVPTALNFGPPPDGQTTAAELVRQVQGALGGAAGWTLDAGPRPPEKRHLALDSALARAAFGWRPRLSPRQSVEWTAAWYAAWARGADMRAVTREQWAAYRRLAP